MSPESLDLKYVLDYYCVKYVMKPYKKNTEDVYFSKCYTELIAPSNNWFFKHNNINMYTNLNYDPDFRYYSNMSNIIKHLLMR
jgi:hypothetical protein